MASTDARPIPQKNVAYRITFPILDADGDLVTGATGLDSEISKDGGTFADCTNEATEVATASGIYYLDLTSTEMNADCVAIIIKTSSSGAKTTPIILYPEEAGDIRVNVTQLVSDSQSATDLKDFADAGYDPATNKVEGVKLTDTLTTYTSNTPQTGDAFARLGAPAGASVSADIAAIEAQTDDIGVAGAGLTALASAADLATLTAYVDTEVAAIKAKTDNLPAAPAATGDIPTAAAVADAVWDEAIAGHAGVGSTGETLGAAGSAGDPWATALPGAYGAGSAGKIIGDNLNATVSSRASQTSLDTVDDFLDTEIAAILADTNELQTDWANGGRLDLILDARASQTSVDDLPTNAELATALAAADDAVLAAIAALNNLSAAQVNAEVVDALATDTYAEPTGVPAATAALTTKLGYLYMALRNRVDVNSATGKKQFFDDGGAAEWEKDLTDDGTTYSESEGNAP